jgi:putative flippase GtrA
MGSPLTDAYRRFRGLFAELAKFGLVGATAAIVDLGGAAYLHGSGLVGPLSAKAISISVATVLSWLGNRFWTFRHRDNHALLREWVTFFMLNAIGLLIAEAAIGFTYYVLGFHDQVAYNLASIGGTGLGTIFRYWSYKKWVFIAPATLDPVPEEMPVLATYGSSPVAARSSGPAYSAYSGGSSYRARASNGYRPRRGGAHRRR